MTPLSALLALLIISAILSIVLGRLTQPYMLRAVYRRLPQHYVPANQLADDILGQLWNDPISGLLFQMRCRDRIPILMMFDTLRAYGFAECDMQPNQKIEQVKHDVLVKIGRLADSHPDKTSSIRTIENAIKMLGIPPQASWRKHPLGGREPGLLEFLPT